MLNRRDVLSISAQAAATLALTRGGLAAPAADDPSYLPATELLARFSRGELTPLAVLEAQIERIEALNDRIDCITYRHFDEARAAARESTRRYKEGRARPLEGLTVAVKDEYAVKGWVTTMGSRLLENAPPDTEDGPLIDRLRAAGAVFHIQTTVPEFYSWVTTATPLWGVTRNPWNLAYTPGGSSGGSGAALAAGFTTLALGSDMGGSIRIPSAQCGLYGFKAPFGRIPTTEVAYETEGPLARTFDDLNLLTRAMAGPHPYVQSSLRPGLDYPTSYGSITGWKIAFDPATTLSPLDPAVRKALDDALARLKGLGAEIVTVDIGFKPADFEVFMTGLFSSSTGALLALARKDPDKLTPYIRHVIERVGGKVGPEGLDAADKLMASYHRRIQDGLFGKGVKALIMPTLATPLIPAEHGFNPHDDTVTIGGQEVKGLNFVMTWPWNLLNRYPVVAAPIGIGPAGMPMGMQIIADTFDDLTAFQVASAYAKVAPPLFTGNAFPDFRSAPVR